MPKVLSKSSEPPLILTQCAVCRICAWRKHNALHCEFGGPYAGYSDERTLDDMTIDRFGGNRHDHNLD